jgi:muconolactone D-isomerase
MEYLVRIKVSRPVQLRDDEWSDLLDRERDHATDYVRGGRIVRIWRVPGTSTNVGIWRAADATELHDLLVALPLHPFMDVDVECLAQHYLEQSVTKPHPA